MENETLKDQQLIEQISDLENQTTIPVRHQVHANGSGNNMKKSQVAI